MSAKYLIRLDDASEFMDIDKWKPYFNLFDQYSIKPIIAVIPCNKDPKLINRPSDLNFWNNVRSWKRKGYVIALHGYQHLYSTKRSGIIDINSYSEFAGVKLEEQEYMLRSAIEVFNKERIDTKIFVAPAHSFDKNTLIALKLVTDINIVSDGFFLSPKIIDGFYWIPQQLSRPKHKPNGVWTICCHPETATESSLSILEEFLKTNNRNFVEVSELYYDDNIYWSDRLAIFIAKVKTRILKISRIFNGY